MRKLIVGNWKMNMTTTQARAYLGEFLPLLQDAPRPGQEIVLCPSVISLDVCHDVIAHAQAQVVLGAQDVFWEEQGAFTGEISAAMLAGVAKYVLVGHSERRMYRGETDTNIAQKITRALAHDLSPILCVGESIDVYAQQESKQFIAQQLTEGLRGISWPEEKGLIVAYEPIWALSSSVGRQEADPEGVQEVAAHIRATVATILGDTAARKLRVLFGGNVQPQTAHAFASGQDVDGVLVGSASTHPASFFQILTALEE